LTSTPTPLLPQDIASAIAPNIYQELDALLVHDTVSSTNDVLWQHLNQTQQTKTVCLTETQTAGRGRQGGHWHSPNSGNLYLSLMWPFSAEMPCNGLSIAIGISLINTLKAEGINDLQVKWPNDILVNRKKLAGILVESRIGKTQNVVIGIGLNFKLPLSTQTQIDQPTTSLQQICDVVPCRNELAGKIIQNMIETIKQFQQSGLTNFLPQWTDYDALHQ
jgi:BirA family biotin operon repressor/biotin-[acetyl-CoA-carboxylase] ligase